MADDRQVNYRELTLSGRLRTADDPAELISEGGVVDFQTVQNMRYTDRHPQGIGGTTKVNSTALGNPQIKAIAQFRKDFPAEANVLVSARDSNGANQKVYKNGAVVPATGDFTATALFTDTTGYGLPKFSTAPGDKIMYCNGKDTAVWGGSQMMPVGFLDKDPNGTYKYDYTTQVTNALTDSNNVATLHRRSDTADANTMLLLHMDGANGGVTFTDSSPTTAHTVTPSGNTNTSTAQKVFGTASALFDGTGDYLTVSYTAGADADFDFTGGVFTVDCRVRLDTSAIYKNEPIWSFGTDASNYAMLSKNTSESFVFSVFAAGVEVVGLDSGYAVPYILPAGTPAWAHVAVVENGDTYYLFVNGQLRDSVTDTGRLAEYTGLLIGNRHMTGGTWSLFEGHIDEFRISNSARWVASFDLPTLAYGSGNVTTFYVASQLPLQGINPYVGTVNTTAGSVTGSYWGTGGWTSLGTIAGVGATPLSSAGQHTWTFTDTKSVAKQKSIDDKVAYWYRFDITECDTTTTLYQVTLDAPMQTLKELWDGAYRTTSSFLVYKNLTFNDYTLNVFKDSYSSTGAAADNNTLVELDSLLVDTNFLVAGFTERLMGLRCHLVGGHVNTTADTVATVSYYNGSGVPTSASSWTSVGTLDDGTSNNGISFAKNGAITWTSPELSQEFKGVLGAAKNSVPIEFEGEAIQAPITPGTYAGGGQELYYYKISFSQTLSADVQAFYIAGITAPEAVAGHKFSVHHLDRVWFWGDEKDPHRGFCSGTSAAQVLRGNDTMSIWLKNTPVAGVSLFERYGSTAANVQLVCEPTRTWAIIGETVENFTPSEIDSTRGCTAPLTMDVATVEVLPGTYHRVGIWQAQDAIVMCDGSAVVDISRDIRDKFDPKRSEYIGASILPTCSGWIDPVFNEYHWVIPGTTQWVYDILRKKWYEAPLVSGKRISCGAAVYDTSGVAYSYGATSSGHMYRMDYGTTVDGTGIPFVLQTGDIAPTGGIVDRTEACSVRLIGKAKSTTAQTVLVEHFGDTSTTASVPAISGVSMTNSGKRLFNVVRPMGMNPKNHTLHSFKTSITTTDETVGYEPVFLILGHRFVGKDTR